MSLIIEYRTPKPLNLNHFEKKPIISLCETSDRLNHRGQGCLDHTIPEFLITHLIALRYHEKTADETFVEADEPYCGYEMELQMVAGTQDEVVAVTVPHHCRTCR